MAAHKSFYICRRFSRLRARLLLLKQDKLSALEEQLEKIDQEERAAFCLGSSRDDANEERKLVLADIDKDLAEYGTVSVLYRRRISIQKPSDRTLDKFLQRNHEILKFEDAEPRDVLSLQNWVKGNACLSLEETDYLTHLKDLLTTSTSSEDHAATRLEAWVEDQSVCFFDRFRMVCYVILLLLAEPVLINAVDHRRRHLGRSSCAHFLRFPDQENGARFDTTHNACSFVSTRSNMQRH